MLVVDDNEACQDVGRFLFEDILRVEVAQNGAEAIAFISAQIPRLILLDLHMPVMDGYQVLDYLQADPIRAAVPVIIWSADYTVCYKENDIQWPAQVVGVLKKGKTDLNDLKQLCLSQLTKKTRIA